MTAEPRCITIDDFYKRGESICAWKRFLTSSLLLLLMVCIPGYAAPRKPESNDRKSIGPQSVQTDALDDYLQQATKGHPQRWFDTDMAIRVLIKPGRGTKNFEPHHEEVLRSAFKEWEEVSSSHIRFRFVTESPADITCEFVAKVPGVNDPNTAGLTHYQSSPHHMDNAVIYILTREKSWLADSYLRITCLHEIGHALGLVNHSLNPHDVMYPYLNTGQKDLSERDKKTICKLYEFKPPDSVLLIARTLPKDGFAPSDHISLSSDDYDEYTRQVVSHLGKEFKPADTSPMLECDVTCFVDSTGNIFNYRVLHPSGKDEFDEEVLESLASSVPLPPVSAALLKNHKWSRTPIAIRYRSDGLVIPFVEPDPNQSDWLAASESPSPKELLRELEKQKKRLQKQSAPSATEPVISQNDLAQWTSSVYQKAHDSWSVERSGRAEIVLGIDSSGRISDMVISNPSGDESFDRSVLNACVSAEPYPVAPNANGITYLQMVFQH